MIEETIDREIRPSLRQDGGDVDIIDIIGNRVLVATRGACATCKAADITLKHFVEHRLRNWFRRTLRWRRYPNETRLFRQ